MPALFRLRLGPTDPFADRIYNNTNNASKNARINTENTLRWRLSISRTTANSQAATALDAAGALTGSDVRRIMARVIEHRGAPTRIRSDNGSEFICTALMDWLPAVGAKSIPVVAASSWENEYIEAFHNRLRDEFLERAEFDTVADAREKGKWFRRYYSGRLPQAPARQEQMSAHLRL
jgi:transposase InsO family protein